jgi:transposase
MARGSREGRTHNQTDRCFEAGRDGFWLARWLRARDIEVHVIHASGVAVSREHRRAKTDRLDTELLKRAFLGWLRGERDHCKMVAIPTLQTKIASGPIGSARAWSESKVGSSIESKKRWSGWASEASIPN